MWGEFELPSGEWSLTREWRNGKAIECCSSCSWASSLGPGMSCPFDRLAVNYYSTVTSLTRTVRTDSYFRECLDASASGRSRLKLFLCLSARYSVINTWVAIAVSMDFCEWRWNSLGSSEYTMNLRVSTSECLRQSVSFADNNLNWIRRDHC